MTITENYFNPSYNEPLSSNTKNSLECDSSDSDLETKQKATDILRKTALGNTSTTHQDFGLDSLINSLNEENIDSLINSLNEENIDSLINSLNEENLDSFINFLSEENSDNAFDSLLNETDQTITSVSACQKALLNPLDPASIDIYSDHSYSKLSEIELVQAISNVSSPKEVINKSTSKKNTYNLRYGPYRSSQEKYDLSPECKKQEIMSLLNSGVDRTAIKNLYNISSKTLKKWHASSPGPFGTANQEDKK